MATISLKHRRKMTGAQVAVSTVGIGTYATGGVAIDPKKLGLTRVDYLAASPAGGYVFEYDYATGKLKAYRNGGADAGPLQEVPNATNLSAVVTSVLAIGI